MEQQPASSELTSGAQRREAWIAEQVARTGIDEAMIRKLVDDFYSKVRRDPALAQIFKSRVANWQVHLGTMYDFWSGVALMTGRYKGKPVQKHLPLPIRATHFARWLHLFRESARNTCPPAAAEFFIDRAERIAESLQFGIREAGGPFAPENRATEPAVQRALKA